jgi:hypothetical protein
MATLAMKASRFSIFPENPASAKGGPRRSNTSGQNVMRKVDGWESLAQKPSDEAIDLAA